MSDWNPQVVTVEKVVNLPNSNNLDLVTVLGDYPVISKRDEYKVGDLAAYIPIDTIVPDTDQFFFLCPKDANGLYKFPRGMVPERYRRIKAKRLRGTYSQGLLIPLPVSGMIAGDSIVEILSLKKWEEEEEDNLPVVKKTTGANAEKKPQGWAIPYYDIESARKNLALLEDEEVVLTEKVHGSNFAACHDGKRLVVKSRNFYKRKNEDDAWWDAALRLNLEEKLQKYPMYVFFGELAGQVKGFPYATTIGEKVYPTIKWWERALHSAISYCKLNKHCANFFGELSKKKRRSGTKENVRLTTVYFFDIWDVKNGRYLDYEERISILQDLNLPVVPELYRGKWLGKEEMYKYAEGKSAIDPTHIREGFIVTPLSGTFASRFHNLKIIGEGYNLQK